MKHRITHHPRDERQRQTHPEQTSAARRLNRIVLSHGLCLQSLRRKRRSQSEGRWPLLRVSDLAPSLSTLEDLSCCLLTSTAAHCTQLPCFLLKQTDFARWYSRGMSEKRLRCKTLLIV